MGTTARRHASIPAGWIALPTAGRREREHLLQWILREETYVAEKFDDQRDGHDASLVNDGLDDFWHRQIVQYLDRAKVFLEAAAEPGIPEAAQRQFQLRAQQALAKCMMTAKGLVESSIRTYGPLPAPGVSSGNIEDWDHLYTIPPTYQEHQQ